MKTTATILAGVLAAQQVVATGWGESSHYNNPANTNNNCDKKQHGGWDFNDLPTGPFSSYGDHDFSGFTCKTSSNKHARDLTRRGGFSGNCIAGSAHSAGGPSFKCGKSQEGFSVNQIHVSTEHDQDVEFHYELPGGQTCKHTSPCKAGGNIVQNDQCGGATSFSVQLPHTATSSCSVSIYSVGFDCSTASTSVPAKTTPSVYVPPYTSAPFPSTTPESPVTTSSVPSPYSPPKISSSPSLPPFPSYSKPSVPLYTGPSSSPLSPVIPSSTPSVPVYTSPASSPSVPVYTPPGSAPSSPASPETPSIPSYSAPTTPGSPVTPTPYTPVPSSTCPDVLPKCLNTWMFQTGCSDNGDYACYCKQPDFASKVCGCLSSYGADEDETAKAVSFLLGICSDFVGSNYGLAMNCPAPSKPTSPAGPSTTPESPVTPTTFPETQTTVIVTQTISTCTAGQTVTSGTITTTLATPSPSTVFITSTSTICTKCTAPPPVTNAPPASSPVSPVTTISVSTTLTVPATYTTGESVGLTVPSSSSPTVIATTYTVPQVFPTAPAGSSAGGLAYGPAPATTPASPVAGVPGSPSGGFGTAYTPKGTSAAPIAQFTGAANKMAAGSFGGLVVAGLALAL